MERPTTSHREPMEPRSRETLSRRDPFAISSFRDPLMLFDSMRRQMDRIFDNFGLGQLERNLWSPQIEMREQNGKLLISADLPGLSKDDVHVEINDNVLTIEGERKHESRDEERGFSERSYGHFFRSIPLPENVNAEKANATFNNGVLEITLDAPKRETQHGRKIEIK